jgi:hypothetical protein
VELSGPWRHPRTCSTTTSCRNFFNAGRKDDLAAIGERVPLVVVEEVHQEALDRRQRGGEYRAWQAQGHLAVRPLLAGSVGSTCLGQLYKRTSGKDLGEYASIALAIEDPTLVLVTNDKNAHWIAARELIEGTERVLRFWAFLRRMQPLAKLTPSDVAAVVQAPALSNDAPLWLPSWMAGLPP